VLVPFESDRGDNRILTTAVAGSSPADRSPSNPSHTQ